MGRNRIDEFTPETSMTDRLRRLENEVKQFKLSPQTPTVRFTEVSESYVTLYDDFGSDIVLSTTMTHPTGKLLMAVPEVNIQLVWPDGTPESKTFPEGQFIQGLIPAGSIEYMQFDWWFDFQSSFFSGVDDLTAFLRFRLDAAIWDEARPGASLWYGFGFKISSRWRYILVGDS